MRELGKEDLQLAKDVLCAFEERHHPNSRVHDDIQEGLFWNERLEAFEADLGFLLRGTYEIVRIYEVEDDWLEDIRGYDTPIAFVEFKDKFYFFLV